METTLTKESWGYCQWMQKEKKRNMGKAGGKNMNTIYLTLHAESNVCKWPSLWLRLRPWIRPLISGWGWAEWIVWQRHQVATKGKNHLLVPSWVCWVWCQWGNHDSCLDSDVEGMQTPKMPFCQFLRVFRPKGWFFFYEGKFSPLEGMVTLIIYLIINQYYLGYLLIFTGVNQWSVNWHRWSFIHCL